MSEDNLENLPSIEDLVEGMELPSVEEFIEKEKDEVEEIIKEEGLEEEALDDKISVESLGEILRLISDVRKDIPNIPEIKYYDKELKELSEHIWEVKRSVAEIPEQRTYDTEVEAVCEQIDLLKGQISELPEVKYYDEHLSDLEDRIDILKENIPEQKTYDAEIEAICEQIDLVKSQIPSLPEWVNEDSLPDLSWVGRTFSVIDDDFVKVKDQIQTVRDKITFEIKELSELVEIKDFDRTVDVKNVKDNLHDTKAELKEDIKKTSDKIYKELKESALRIWEYQKSFKDDDRKLKKQILGEYQVLKKNVNEQIKEYNDKNVESQNVVNESLRVYFKQLQKEIAELPEVKYYDESIDELKENISNLTEKVEDKGTNIAELYRIVEELKGTQQTLTEEITEVYNDRPIGPDPELKQAQDPLTPTDQKFATLKDLAANYRLFVNRVEQQLYTIGGGGAGYIKDLADVDITGITTGHLLIYGGGSSGTDWVGIASTALSPSTTLDDVLTNGNTSTGGMTVGVITATNGYFTGIFTAASLNYDNVTDIYSTGIITATKGIQITTLGLNIAAGVATLTDGLRVGSAATIYSNGNASFAGIVTASSYVGDGSNLTGLPSGVTINTNADNRIITGSDSANTLNGESTLTYDGTKFSVSTGGTIFTNGNIAAAGIVTANGGFVGDLTGDVTGDVTGTADVATLATNVTVSANNSGDETVYPIFVDGATGTQGAESDTGLTYNPSDGNLTATTFTGALTGNVTGNINGDLTGTLQTAAQANVTSLGTLTTLTVDNVIIDGTTIGHTSDTDLMTLADGAITLSGQTNVGTAATLYANGNITAGIITATNFVGDGSGLTDVPGGASEEDTAVSSTSATSVYSIAHASYRSASIIIQVTQGSAYQTGRYLVIHDGTTATIVEESAIATGSMLATFTSAIVSTNLVVYVNMGSASSATVTVLATALTV